MSYGADTDGACDAEVTGERLRAAWCPPPPGRPLVAPPLLAAVALSAQGPPNGGCRGSRMAGRPAAARRGKHGRAGDPPEGCAGRSWL